MLNYVLAVRQPNEYWQSHPLDGILKLNSPRGKIETNRKYRKKNKILAIALFNK